MIIRGYGEDGDIWSSIEDQIEATKKKAVDAATSSAKSGATRETAKFWTTAAWYGVGALLVLYMLKR